MEKITKKQAAIKCWEAMKKMGIGSNWESFEKYWDTLKVKFTKAWFIKMYDRICGTVVMG